MTTLLSKPYLRRLRNEIHITPLIADILRLEHRQSDGRFRFLCPECREFHTAVNPKTNLARCFRCKRNFNPIDMVMTIKRMAFLEAVDFLAPYLNVAHLQRNNNAAIQPKPYNPRL